MTLCASLIVRNELGRFLEPCVAHLLGFCDEIRILDDHSDDGTWEWLLAQDNRVQVVRVGSAPAFFTHEGKARNALLRWTLESGCTHVLSVDADEFVTDGAAVRAACQADHGAGVWQLTMSEVWKADASRLWTREDGGWKACRVPVVWRAPAKRDGSWRIQDKALACGREPMPVRAARQKTLLPVSLLHWGWTNQAEREQRYQRYVEHDGGRFHNDRHLRSILWSDKRVRLKPQPWPDALEPWRDLLLARVNGEPVAA